MLYFLTESRRVGDPMKDELLHRPSALIPIVMSTTALAIVLGYAVVYGVAPQADEGIAAHMWQILMVGQVPVMAFYAIKWFPTQHKRALLVLALQLGAALAAIFPVWWFRW
jgi:hypothetical protein